MIPLKSSTRFLHIKRELSLKSFFQFIKCYYSIINKIIKENQITGKLLIISTQSHLYFKDSNSGRLIFLNEKIRVSKGGSQPSSWQIAQSIDCFCDLERKLENLSLPVDAQCFAAMDGSKSLNVPWTSSCHNWRV